MAWHTDALWREMERQGWSQADLARRMGVDQATVSRVRRGIDGPGLRFLRGVERALPTHDPRKLVWWTDDPPTVEGAA